MQTGKRPINRRAIARIRPLIIPTQAPWTLEPDDLRNRVQNALSTRSYADRKDFSRRLLTALAKAGVQAGTSLFMIGITAYSPDHLTPSDMGKLLRYIRINTPGAIKSISRLLAELVGQRQEPALRLHRIAKAA